MVATFEKPLWEAPKPGAHTYGRRLKRCFVPMHVLQALLNLDGTRSYKMEGWPEGAKIVGAEIRTKPFCVMLMVFHPEFLVVPPNELPPLIKVTARAAA